MQLIKWVCNRCRNEMESDPPSQWESKLMPVTLKVEATEDFHLCRYCAIDLIVREFDDRPREG